MGVKAAGLEELITPLELRFKVLYLVSFWCEVSRVGIYVCLFGAALTVMLRKGRLDAFSSKVFFVGIVVMFILISIHNWLNVYRLIVAYAYQIEVPAPVTYLRNIRNWDAYAFPVLLAMIIWLGDALVIYRCYLIWKRSWKAVALPILLLLTSISTHSVTLHWFRTAFIPLETIRPLLNTTFPLHLAQNVITTSLITYKIWAKHVETKRAGMQDSFTASGLNLIGVIRIVIESAAVYTMQMIIAVVLQLMDHPARVLLQHCLIPTTGIVFVLIAIRADTIRQEASQGRKVQASDLVLPAWMGANTQSSQDRLGKRTTNGHGSVPIQIMATVTEEYRMDDITSDMKIRSRNNGSSTTTKSKDDLESG
ncbi:hypothetical protein BKA70DRAFT_1488887, partial [Coprinopsis sp. MPI-PUGE-AT-0042]